MSNNIICRVCLQEGVMRDIFQESAASTISAKLMSLARVQIFPGDGLPSTICRKCLKRLYHCIDFIQLCEDSDAKLRATFSDGSVNISPKRENDDFNEYKCQNLVIISKHEIEETITTETNLKKNRTKKYQCTVCGKILSSGFRLQSHLRTHSGERPFLCPHCSKSFKLKATLKMHLRIHTGEKSLKCTECNATFRHSSTLIAHKRKHSGESPYQCALCPKSFHTAGHLRYHVRRHTGEKNFECDTCGKAFLNSSHLQQHNVMHSGERPHMCFVCGLRLTRISHLKRHMQNLHKTNLTPPKPTEEVQEDVRKGQEQEEP